MVVVMKERATDEQVQRVISQLVEMGFDVHRSTGALRTVIGAVGGNRAADPRLLEVLDGVQEVLRITEPYKLASRTFKPENTVISVGDVRVGGDEVIVMAGPCSVESEPQVRAAAAAVRRAGAKILRGGAFKPRSSPYSFQGLGEEGLRMLRSAANEQNMKLVSEEVMVQALSHQLNLPASNLDAAQIPVEVLDLIPAELAEQHSVIPFSRQGTFLDVAMADPTNLGIIDEPGFGEAMAAPGELSTVPADSRLVARLLRSRKRK